MDINPVLIFVVLIIVAIVILTVTITTRKSSLKVVDTGYINGVFASSAIYNRYSYYFSVAASRWVNRVSYTDTIKVNITDFAENSDTVAWATITDFTENNLTKEGTISVNRTVFNSISDELKIVTFEHELGHIYGVGTWEYEGTGAGLRIKPLYENCLEKFNLLTDAEFTEGVPIESAGGGGTAGAHWENSYRENFAGSGEPSKGLTNELMTGTLNSNSALSSVTLGFLEDLGWTVDYDTNEDDDIILDSSSLSKSFLNENSVKCSCAHKK